MNAIPKTSNKLHVIDAKPEGSLDIDIDECVKNETDRTLLNKV